MKFLPILIFVIGCAVSTEELIQEAQHCAAISDSGQCWAEVNGRLEFEEKRRRKRQASQCPNKQVAWCEWHGCGCVSHQTLRGLFE